MVSSMIFLKSRRVDAICVPFLTNYRAFSVKSSRARNCFSYKQLTRVTMLVAIMMSHRADAPKKHWGINGVVVPDQHL